MVREYMTELYEPAHSSHLRILQADYSVVRERARWNARIREVWDRVKFVEAGPGPAGSVTSGKPVPVRAAIDLAGLKPDDVRVEAVIGRVDSNGHLEETEVLVLPAGGAAGLGGRICQGHRSRTHRPPGLRAARQPQPF